MDTLISRLTFPVCVARTVLQACFFCCCAASLGFFALTGPGLRAQTLDANFNPSPDGLQVSAMAQQADGKILIGGDFTQVAGVARTGFARLNADGSLDTSFNPILANVPPGPGGFIASFPSVRAIAVQPDGKIIIGGAFDQVGGMTRNYIARLNADGTLDTGFYPGTDNTVWFLALQPDGNILIAGQFSHVVGTARIGLARLNSVGSLDTGFNPPGFAFHPTSPSGPLVFTVAVQPDGRILAGGEFQFAAGVAHSCIVRLNADGTLDGSFNPSSFDPAARVDAIALQPDGKIIVSGNFSQIAGTTHYSVARLFSDGTLEAGFNPGRYGDAWSIVIQPDSKIIFGGVFAGVGGVMRVNSDGTLDTSLNGSTDASVHALVLQPGGEIVLGGPFTQVAGVGRNHLARLAIVPTITAPPGSQTVDTGMPATFTVTAAGTAPFSYQWFKNGAAIAGAMNATLTLPSVAMTDEAIYTVRVTNGAGNVTSMPAILTVAPAPPGITTPLADQTVAAGGSVTFTITASGTAPLSYQWFKNGVEIAGATIATLTLTDVQVTDAGSYTVMVSNGSGSATSAANLTVTPVPPSIATPLASQTVTTGGSVTFSVVASGPPPLSYQWFNNGIEISGATITTLTLTNVQVTASGSLFTVVVANGSGSVTSAATLTVTP